MSYTSSRPTNSRTSALSTRKPLASPTPVYRHYNSSVPRNLELTAEQRDEIKEAFDIFDADHDQMIDYHELKVAMRALGFDAKKQEVLKIIRDHDKTGKNLLLYEDFARISSDRLYSPLLMIKCPKRSLVETL